jgi:anti-anti-sigma regulatory factor
MTALVLGRGRWLWTSCSDPLCRPPTASRSSGTSTLDDAEAVAPTARLRCRGDLDIATVGPLLDDIDDLIGVGYRRVRLELDRLLFCDVVGLDALLSVRDRVRRCGGTLVVSPHQCGSLDLLLHTLGLSSQFDPLATR